MQRLKYLDGLKGFGCLMVFITHLKMFEFTYPYELFSMINEVFYGEVIINVFLAASAYGITASIHSNLKKGNGLRTLILKRYFRLAIPVAFALIVSALFYYGGLIATHQAVEHGGHPLLVQFYKSLSLSGLAKAFFLSPFGETFGWLSPAWMMKYFLYGTFMTIAFVLGTEGLKQWKKYLICLFFIFLFYFIDVHMIYIIMGFMLFEYLQSKKEFKYDRWIAILFFLLYLGFRAIIYFCHFHRHGDTCTVLSILFLIGITHAPTLQKFFSTKPMLWLGKISLSIYLLHFILVCSLSCWLFVLLQGLHPFISCTINLFVTGAVLILLSWVSQKYFEDKVSNTLTKKIVQFLEK